MNSPVEFLTEKIGYINQGEWRIGLKEDVNIDEWVNTAKALRRDELRKIADKAYEAGRLHDELLSQFDSPKSRFFAHLDLEIYGKKQDMSLPKPDESAFFDSVESPPKPIQSLDKVLIKAINKSLKKK
jgi:hypothetical protein